MAVKGAYMLNGSQSTGWSASDFWMAVYLVKRLLKKSGRLVE